MFSRTIFLLIGCIATYPSSWPKSSVTRPLFLGVARTGEWALSTLGRNIETTTVSKRNLLSGDKWILCNFYKIRVIHDHFIYLTWDFLFWSEEKGPYISLHACKYIHNFVIFTRQMWCHHFHVNCFWSGIFYWT